MVASVELLLRLISDHNATFYIPPYQRNYEWDRSDCESFFTDIENTAKNKTEHFFGTITYYMHEPIFGQPDRLTLIDGQQRITTSMLFLMAYRDICDDENIKLSINSEYLKNERAKGSAEFKIKLKQVESDWDVYKKMVLSYKLSPSEMNSPLYRNYLYFVAKLRGMKEDGNDISVLVNKGLQKLNVVTIQLQPEKNDWENPQDIFESMNSLGKPLSFSDLVRNYLLLPFSPEEQEEIYSKDWLEVERNIPGRISDFLRDYMQMKECRMFPKATAANSKALYSSFKTAFSGTSHRTLLEDIHKYSSYYAMIVLGASTGNAEIDRKMSDIRLLGTSTSYSFCMGIINAWKNGFLMASDVLEVFDALFVFFLRRRICGLAAFENKAMPAIVRDIPELCEAENKREKMFDILCRWQNAFRLPNNAEVGKALSEMNFYTFKHSKLIFALIEEDVTKCRPNINDPNLSIEHIMPQTLNDEWVEYLGMEKRDLYQEKVHNIGNLTIVRHNSELGRKSFDEKKEIYEKVSGLQISKIKITDQDVWNIDAIDNRTVWLSYKILNDILPIPKSMQYANNYEQKENTSISFSDLGLIGKTISFTMNPMVTAVVSDEKKVFFEGKEQMLSALTKELVERTGMKYSKHYPAAKYWECRGVNLCDL